MSRKEIISFLERAASIRTSDYTPEMIQAVQTAALSDDPELYQYCCLAVHKSLKKYENSILKRFGVSPGSQDYEDYLQELFIVILEDMKYWDSSKGALTTHFVNRFKKACISTRNEQHSTFSSTHYELVHADIKRAVEVLEQNGVHSPTPLEIRNQIALMKKEYSEQTIINCMEQIKDVSSIDANRDIADGITTDPIYQVIAQEKKDDILRCIASLEPQHRLIMEIEYKICQAEPNSNRKVANRLIAEEFRNIVGPASDEWIKNIRDAAEREFQHRYQTEKYYTQKQVQVSNYMSTEYILLEDDIRRAISEDVNALFADDEEDDVSAKSAAN